MNTIAINRVFFVGALSGLSRAKDSIDTRTFLASLDSYNSPALAGYLECFEELRQVMKLYRELVTKDIMTMNKISIKMSLFDSYLARLWRAW